MLSPSSGVVGIFTKWNDHNVILITYCYLTTGRHGNSSPLDLLKSKVFSIGTKRRK